MGQESLNASHQGMERGTGVALAEVSRCEALDEAVDAETTHGLGAEAEAGVGVTAHDQAPVADDLAVLIDREAAGPHGFVSAAAEDA